MARNRSKEVQEQNLVKRPAGRPKGAPNQIGKSIKDMLMASLQKQGGQKYFDKLAVEQPKSYAMLISKLLPLQLTNAEGTEALRIKIEYTKPTEE